MNTRNSIIKFIFVLLVVVMISTHFFNAQINVEKIDIQVEPLYTSENGSSITIDFDLLAIMFLSFLLVIRYSVQKWIKVRYK